jgi:hypothetical protein
MSLRIGIASVVFLALTATTSYAGKTVLVVNTDPSGADVHADGYGLLGQTPLNYVFKKQATKSPLRLKISKKGYVSISETVFLIKGKEFKLKKDLFERLSHFEISSDPDGAAVFVWVIDTDEYRDADADTKADLRTRFPNEIIRRFLGNTPIRYQDDPEKPLGQNDLLVFEKAGYKSDEALFKIKERRLHFVMKPLQVKER